jgi:integrase
MIGVAAWMGRHVGLCSNGERFLDGAKGGGGGRERRAPGAGNRRLPVRRRSWATEVPQQAEYLLSLGIAQDADTYVVTNAYGRTMHPRTLDGAFRRWRKKNGFDVKFHGLRHSASGMLMRSGVDVYTVAQFLGHSPKILLDTYMHEDESVARGAAAKIEQTLSAKNVLQTIRGQ